MVGVRQKHLAPFHILHASYIIVIYFDYNSVEDVMGCQFSHKYDAELYNTMERDYARNNPQRTRCRGLGVAATGLRSHVKFTDYVLWGECSR